MIRTITEDRRKSSTNFSQLFAFRFTGITVSSEPLTGNQLHPRLGVDFQFLGNQFCCPRPRHGKHIGVVSVFKELPGSVHSRFMALSVLLMEGFDLFWHKGLSRRSPVAEFSRQPFYPTPLFR